MLSQKDKTTAARPTPEMMGQKHISTTHHTFHWADTKRTMVAKQDNYQIQEKLCTIYFSEKCTGCHLSSWEWVSTPQVPPLMWTVPELSPERTGESQQTPASWSTGWGRLLTHQRSQMKSRNQFVSELLICLRKNLKYLTCLGFSL